MREMRRYVPALLFLSGIALTLSAKKQLAVPLAGSLQTVLASYEGHDVVEQTITDNERRVAGMTDYVARSYRRDGAVAFTTLVSYYDKQAQGKTIHSPRNCLPGAGWEIMNGEPRVITVDGVERTVNRYVLRNKNASAVAYYWYQGRGRVTANEYAVKWHLLVDATLTGRSEEALVRVVVPVAPELAGAVMQERPIGADTVAQRVVGRMIREVEGVLPQRGGD